MNPASTSTQTVSVNHGIAYRPSTATIDTFYSTDGDGTFYSMILDWDSQGHVTITRSTTSSYPTSTGIFNLIETGLNTSTHDDTLIVTPGTNENYYHIPFDPNEPSSVINGGGNGGWVEAWCENGCSDISKTCGATIYQSNKGTIIQCAGTCTVSCKVAYNKCESSGGGGTGGSSQKTSLPNSAGAIVVEAANVSFN